MGIGLVSDLHNLLGRVIKPHVQGKKECVRRGCVPKSSGVTWAGLYAGRRGACTMVLESPGNVAVAQRLLRHKTADTTLKVYNKGISDKGFEGGMQAFSKSLNKQRDGSWDSFKRENTMLIDVAIRERRSDFCMITKQTQERAANQALRERLERCEQDPVMKERLHKAKALKEALANL